MIRRASYFCRLFCTVLLKFYQNHPVEFVISSFLLFCAVWPISYPTRFGYQYVRLSDIENDVMPCNKTAEQLTSKLPDCPIYPNDLGSNINVQHEVDEEKLENMPQKLNIRLGGRWYPSNCNAKHRVAIIVPYRDRINQLKLFLQHMHPFLKQQQLDYGIFIVEQSQHQEFNRAKLFNVGYAEALKQYNYCCFIFHDVDLLPENPQNLYACSKRPRHMSASLDTFRYVLPYAGLFGGVISISRPQFESVNGFSNKYFGWGGEDDDFYTRLRLSNIKIVRWSPDISRYTMLLHEKATPNPNRYKLLSEVWERHKMDGINSLQYKVLDFSLKPLYTWILVDLKP